MDIDQTLITQSPQETQTLGQSLADSLLTAGEALPHIVCLYGPLGSGKTTFTQGFAKGIGISGRLLSPTFIIVRRYQMIQQENFFYHLDLYRLQSRQDLESVGISEILMDPHAYVFVEWAERLGTLKPARRIGVGFSLVQQGNHRIDINVYE